MNQTAESNRKNLGDLPSQLGALERMTTGALAKKYEELYGEPTRSRNKTYLKKRLAWKLQEQAFGGLSTQALERIAQLGDELPERWRRRLEVTQPPAAPSIVASEPQTVAPVHELRDPRLPPVGTLLRRTWKRTECQVLICKDGFEFKGQVFKTLSAVARAITGTAWNGFAFFDLQSTRETP